MIGKGAEILCAAEVKKAQGAGAFGKRSLPGPSHKARPGGRSGRKRARPRAFFNFCRAYY